MTYPVHRVVKNYKFGRVLGEMKADYYLLLFSNKLRKETACVFMQLHIGPRVFINIHSHSHINKCS